MVWLIFYKKNFKSLNLNTTSQLVFVIVQPAHYSVARGMHVLYSSFAFEFVVTMKLRASLK